jgi:putative PIN family toxin of toxin-antitoxin system
VRVVLDTNVLVSSILLPKSVPGRVFDLVQLNGNLLFPGVTFAELQAVLLRPKFERYLDPIRRDRFLARCQEAGALVEITRTIRACRDVDDDKFLEVAVNGNADMLVTGDTDLLVLGRYEGIPIVTPAHYLATVSG